LNRLFRTITLLDCQHDSYHAESVRTLFLAAASATLAQPSFITISMMIIMLIVALTALKRNLYEQSE
jgi:hypothetical protein